MPQAAISTSRISEEQRRSYRENGYCILESAISPADLALVRQECDAEVRRAEEDMRKASSQNGISTDGRYFIAFPSQRSGRLDPFLYSDLMADICRATIGDDAYLFYDQFVVKGPDRGNADTSFAWHQDSGYVGYPHRPYLTCWCALDDCSVENGTVRVLSYQRAGSRELFEHRWDEQSKSQVGYTGPDLGEAAIIPAGSIVVFSSLTLHCSGSNRTNGYRRAYVVQYAPDVILRAPGQQHSLAVPFLKGGRRLR